MDAGFVRYFCSACNEVFSLEGEHKCINCGSECIERYDQMMGDECITILDHIQMMVNELYNMESGRDNAFLSLLTEHMQRTSEYRIVDDLENYMSEPELEEIMGMFLENDRYESWVPASSSFVESLESNMSLAAGECSICLTKYSNGEKGIRLRCQHFYHEACLKTWLGYKNTCPNCRDILD
jgi:hypothetical protein